MQIYKVGGAVRDKLLGINATDTDYVVVGSSKSEMLKLGFKEVGHDFPVFIHPKTGEEYALARQEKKIATGHRGFEFDVASNISLTDDLKRRDLTINAMAMDLDGNLIDPFSGAIDLKNKCLRHVSASFVEDPLRVLRVARFAAKFNFSVATETLELMQKIVVNGELFALSKERIIEEINKALMTNYIGNFFMVLNQVGALAQIFPKLVPIFANDLLHQEFISLLKNLNLSNYSLEQRFALICFYMSITTIGVDINNKTQNIFVPKNDLLETIVYAPNNQSKRLAKLIISCYAPIVSLQNLKDIDIYHMITFIDPFRHKNDYALFLDLITLLGQIKTDNKVKPNLKILQAIILQIKNIDYTQFTNYNKPENNTQSINPKMKEFILQIKQKKITLIRQELKRNLI